MQYLRLNLRLVQLVGAAFWFLIFSGFGNEARTEVGSTSTYSTSSDCGQVPDKVKEIYSKISNCNSGGSSGSGAQPAAVLDATNEGRAHDFYVWDKNGTCKKYVSSVGENSPPPGNESESHKTPEGEIYICTPPESYKGDAAVHLCGTGPGNNNSLSRGILLHQWHGPASYGCLGIREADGNPVNIKDFVQNNLPQGSRIFNLFQNTDTSKVCQKEDAKTEQQIDSGSNR